MPIYTVEGGHSLHGLVRLGGAKNVSFKLMIAALLGEGESRILNFSQISDVNLVSDIINSLGAKAYSPGERTMFVDPAGLEDKEMDPKFGFGSRASTMFLAPLLAKFGHAKVPFPGGDKIGKRPIDRHLECLQALGAKITVNENTIEATTDGLKGTTYRFSKPTHTGTETALMAAVLAQGKTVLENAAEEPEVDDLIVFLNDMGAKIERHGKTIEIEGVPKLGCAIHKIMPDQNEAVSYAVAAVVTKGDIIVENARKEDMVAFLEKFSEAGGGYELGEYGIRFFYDKPLQAVNIVTEPYPGFKTDWQPLWSVLLTQAQGTSEIHEAIYLSRFQYAEALQEMGAKIEFYNPEVKDPETFYNFDLKHDTPENRHALKITGLTPLKAIEYTVPDLRAGATILLAGLIANGVSKIHDAESHVERGYEEITERLNSMGAQIVKE